MSETLSLKVNGEFAELPAGSSISDLLQSRGLAGKRVAVEMDEQIVPASQHATTLLRPGARLEIIQAIGGG